MREFSNREKCTIEKIASIEVGDLRTFANFLQEDVFSIQNGTAFLFLPEKDIAIFYIKASLSESEKKVKISEFLELISLVEYLRLERYIHSFKFGHAEGLNVMCKEFRSIAQNSAGDITLDEIGHHIKPSNPGNIYDANNQIVFTGFAFKKDESSIYDIMENTLSAPFSPTEELKQFVNHDFKDGAQIKHDQTLFYSKIAIGVAVFFSLISLLVNLINALC